MIRRLLRHIVARVFDWARTEFLKEEYAEFGLGEGGEKNEPID